MSVSESMAKGTLNMVKLVTANVRQTVAPGMAVVDDTIRAADEGLQLATKALDGGSSREISRVGSYGSETWNLAFNARHSLQRANLAGIGSAELATADEQLGMVQYVHSSGFAADDIARAVATHFADAKAAAVSVQAQVNTAVRDTVRAITHHYPA